MGFFLKSLQQARNANFGLDASYGSSVGSDTPGTGEVVPSLMG
jgi:hypothetical protein